MTTRAGFDIQGPVTPRGSATKVRSPGVSWPSQPGLSPEEEAELHWIHRPSDDDVDRPAPPPTAPREPVEEEEPQGPSAEAIDRLVEMGFSHDQAVAALSPAKKIDRPQNPQPPSDDTMCRSLRWTPTSLRTLAAGLRRPRPRRVDRTCRKRAASPRSLRSPRR